jgi:hypothetical protein
MRGHEEMNDPNHKEHEKVDGVAFASGDEAGTTKGTDHRNNHHGVHRTGPDEYTF